jgi:peroxiredoxin Q/BCP
MAAKKKRSTKAAEKLSQRSPAGNSLGRAAAGKASKQPTAAAGRAVSKAPAAKAKAPAAKAKAPAVKAKAPAVKAKAPATRGVSKAAASGATPALGKKKAAAHRPATAALRAAQKNPAEASVGNSVATLQVGDRAPSFELPDQQGGTVASGSLAGQPYVLYFYPKDDTPGCTTQACGFRDAFPQFEDLGVRVLGVSPDSSASHQRFVGKYGLPFTLLSDASRELASAYGVWALKKNYGREFMGIVRSTFLVDASGVVRKVWRGVRVNGHVPEVQAAAAEIARG